MSITQLPALFDHCCEIYDAMMTTAVTEEVEGRMMPVYEGFLTKLFNGRGLSVPYYTSVMQYLKTMESVIQLRRGGGSTKSKWVLVQRPTRALFERAAQTHESTFGARQKSAKTDEIQNQQIRDINRRLQAVESRLGLT